MNKLIITGYQNQILTALYCDNRLLEASLLEEDASAFVGNIYIGRVENIVPSINAAFVEFTKGVKGYLSLAENPKPVFINTKNTKKVCMGDLIIVQVEREPVKTKAAVLTTRLNIPGKYAVVVDDSRGPIMISDKIKNKEKRAHIRSLAEEYASDSFGIVMRTNSENALDEDIRQELSMLIQKRNEILERAAHRTAFTCLHEEESGFIGILKNTHMENLEEILTDDGQIYLQVKDYLTQNGLRQELLKMYTDKLVSLSALYSIDARMKEALCERVWLKSGGYLVMQPTEALIVIDVNTGKYSGNKKDREATFFKINMEAAFEIAHQIRLRNYSGIILIDFIDMDTEEYNRQLIVELKKLIAEDPVKTTYVDMTGLGLIELTRKKVRKPLYEQLKRKERHEKNTRSL
jgi:ribonuclease G